MQKFQVDKVKRIAIARAIYHNKKILILDESTSALDIETEKEIINELVNLRKNFTLIIISHELSHLIHVMLFII